VEALLWLWFLPLSTVTTFSRRKSAEGVTIVLRRWASAERLGNQSVRA